MKSTPRLSIVVISWNSLSRLKACLTSLSELLGRGDTQLVWVDNGSSDGSREWIDAHFPSATTKILPQNMGVAFARNRGVELSTGRYVLFLDDDTEASAEAIDAMIDYMDSHPKAGICGVALRDASGNLQDSFKKYPGIGEKCSNILHSLLRISRPVSLPSHIIETDYLIGACQMIRRAVFDKIGLLDQNIFYGPEDADFCLRAAQAGYAVMYIPFVSITHHWRRATSVNIFGRLGRRHIAGLLHLYRKHHRYF